MKESIELHAIFKGLVQGVFLRAAIQEYATKLKVKGYVRNLKNGTVEMLAQAEKKTLEDLLKKIDQKPGYGKIDSVDKKYCKPKKTYDDFEVID